MTRYEGMENLLQRVRERLGVEGVEAQGIVSLEARTGAPGPNQYSECIDTLLLLGRNAEELTSVVTPNLMSSISPEQRDDLLSMLQRVTRDLWKCRAVLESPPPKGRR